MIKTKTIKTDKAEILVIGGLPENASRFKVFNDESPYLSYSIGVETFREYDMPAGNWHPIGFLKDISEEQWEHILPEKEVSTNYEFKTIEGYRGYGNNKSVLYTDIRCAGISLVEANCKLENKYGQYPTKENTHLEYGMRYIGIVEEWEEEQGKVFTKPFLLKKID